MENQIKGLTIKEMAEKIRLPEKTIKEYISGPLKEEIVREKLYLGKDSAGEHTFDPYTLNLLLIEYSVDKEVENLEKNLDSIRESKRKAA